MLGHPTQKGKQEDGSRACSFCRGEEDAGRWGSSPLSRTRVERHLPRG